MSGSHDHQRYPHLSQLRLSNDDFAALARQGFVSSEQRGACLIFKLRFRCAATARQRVRYIGTNCSAADAVSGELARLQRAALQNKRLRRLEADARRILRETKDSVELVLDDSDYHFYGLEIRGHRRRASTDENARDQRPIDFEKVK